MRSMTCVWTVFCGVTLLAGSSPVDAAMTRNSAERLMASGKNMTCDYKTQESGVDQQGTVYLSKGKMRGDFKVTDPGSGTYDAHMVQDGSGWAYMWGGPMGEARGTKMRVDGAGRPGEKPQGFDARQEMDMDCREWSADASKFDVPRNVEFMDLSSMMSGAMAAMGKCQACEQVPAGDDREQCRQMMGCA